MNRRTRDGGGQPAEYWALPFAERWRFHAPPGVVGRDVSLTGLVTEDALREQKSRSVGSPHSETLLHGSGAVCAQCGRILEDLDSTDGRQRLRLYCSDRCRGRAWRSKHGRSGKAG